MNYGVYSRIQCSDRQDLVIQLYKQVNGVNRWYSGPLFEVLLVVSDSLFQRSYYNVSSQYLQF